MFKKYTTRVLFVIILSVILAGVLNPVSGMAAAHNVSLAPSNNYIAAKDPSCDTDPHCCDNDPNCLTDKYINPAINFLGIGFGIIVVIMLVIGGLQYGTSAGDPQQVANAKKRIRNAILALVAFAFMYAFLQWLVPGGIF